MRLRACAVLFLVLWGVAECVDRSKYKTCKDSGFCRRNRNRNSTHAGAGDLVPPPTSFRAEGHTRVRADLAGGRLFVMVRSYDQGIVRVTVDENPTPAVGLAPRFRPDRFVLDPGLKESGKLVLAVEKGAAAAVSNEQGSRVTFAPQGSAFGFAFAGPRSSGAEISFEKLLFESHARKPPPPPPAPEAPATEGNKTEEEGQAKTADAPAAEEKGSIDAGWEETYGGNTDSKPNGPGAVGMDVKFVASERLYGIPEHATSLALKDTVAEVAGEGEKKAYGEPYRFYNTDVFEYEVDDPMSLYGAVPLVLAHSSKTGRTVGVFWLNPSETWIDVSGTTNTRWTSEDGLPDLFILPGPTPEDVFRQYGALTGRPSLPPRFSIAYHQCRWNYIDEPDVRAVDAGFDQHDIPYDVLWLDIEHTDGKKYFTWDSVKFPNPTALQAELLSRGRKMVTIVDPHIKRDTGYHVHSEAQSKHYVKSPGGNGDYEGHCWPGSSSWVDFLSDETREWWGGLFGFDRYKGATKSLFVWNDMNEPAIFGGPEATMPKDCVHSGGVEHRAVHNMYGLLNTMATHAGLMKRDPNVRPFVLTRSFFAGSQRYASVWTGDVHGKWDHLAQSLPMVLTLNLVGIHQVGADVGGFFGNPETELLVRWYQAGAWYPFFRAHAHLETRRREPWLFGDATTSLLRKAVRTRYQHLPYWYTTFSRSSLTGIPVARALWTVFPNDPAALTIHDEFLVGDSILVHPVTSAGQNSTQVYLPGRNEVWYEARTLKRYAGGATVTVESGLDLGIPVFYRGGSIIPRQDRARRSSEQMKDDPYTLVVCPNSEGKASGELYIDDGISFDYKKGSFAKVEFRAEKGVITGVVTSKGGYTVKNALEKIIVAGESSAPREATDRDGKKLKFAFNKEAHTTTVKKPAAKVAPIAPEWQVTLVR